MTWLSEPLNDFNDGRCPGSKLQIHEFLYTAAQKVAGYNVIPSKLFECPSIRLSIRASFPGSNFS